MKEKIIVFAGPTISHQEVQKILPNAYCHAPIKCGDILKVLRLAPTKIVIIDGDFGHVGATWHKEILFALANQVSVLGASSMGALRAAELDVYGMKGFGEIYHLYKSAQINGDDEVAIIHADKDHQYQSGTLPLVNIRCTLNKAIADGVATADIVADIIQQIKYLPYFERTFAQLTDIINDKCLVEWFRDHYIDQKKIDAIGLLKHLNNNQFNIHPPLSAKLNNTVYIQRLYREMMSAPFDQSYDWLPTIEKRIHHVRESQNFKHFVLLSKLLHISYDICVKEVHELSTAGIIEIIKKQIKSDEVDLVRQYCAIYCDRYRLTHISHDGEVCISQSSLFKLMALLLQYIINYISNNGIILNSIYVNAFLDIFRRDNQLLKADALKQWLEENKLTDKSRYNRFLIYASILYFVVEQNNADYIGIETSMNNIFWLGEAVKVYNTFQ